MDIEDDKVADKLHKMVVDNVVEEVADISVTLSIRWWWLSAWVTGLECPEGVKDEVQQAQSRPVEVGPAEPIAF